MLLPAGAWLPFRHTKGSVEPVEQKRPSGQVVHWSALCKSVALEKVPAGHGSGTDERAAQNEPGTHATHPVAFAAGWRVPAVQSAHL